MLFVAGKSLCNIHFWAYGKSRNLESGTGNETSSVAALVGYNVIPNVIHKTKTKD